MSPEQQPKMPPKQESPQKNWLNEYFAKITKKAEQPVIQFPVYPPSELTSEAEEELRR